MIGNKGKKWTARDQVKGSKRLNVCSKHLYYLCSCILVFACLCMCNTALCVCSKMKAISKNREIIDNMCRMKVNIKRDWIISSNDLAFAFVWPLLLSFLSR